MLMFFYSHILYTWLNENWFCLMPVSPSVPEMWGGGGGGGGHPFLRMYLGGVYIPCIYTHAR